MPVWVGGLKQGVGKGAHSGGVDNREVVREMGRCFDKEGLENMWDNFTIRSLHNNTQPIERGW